MIEIIIIYNQHRRAALRPVWNICIWTSTQNNFTITLATTFFDTISVIYKYFVLFSSKQLVLKYYWNEESWQFLHPATIYNTTISENYLPKKDIKHIFASFRDCWSLYFTLLLLVFPIFKMSCILRHRTQCSLLVFGYKINDQIYNHLIIHRLEPHKSYSYENNFLRPGQKPKKSARFLSVFTSSFPLSNFPLATLAVHIRRSSSIVKFWFSFLSFSPYNLYILKLFVVRLFVSADTEWGPNKPMRCFCLRCSVI